MMQKPFHVNGVLLEELKLIKQKLMDKLDVLEMTNDGYYPSHVNITNHRVALSTLNQIMQTYRNQGGTSR